jgi:hypothetical protein
VGAAAADSTFSSLTAAADNCRGQMTVVADTAHNAQPQWHRVGSVLVTLLIHHTT